MALQASETFGLGEDPVTLPSRQEDTANVVVETTNLLEVPLPLGSPMRSTSVGDMGCAAAASKVNIDQKGHSSPAQIPCVFKWTAKSSAAVFKRSHTNRKTVPNIQNTVSPILDLQWFHFDLKIGSVGAQHYVAHLKPSLFAPLRRHTKEMLANLLQ